MFAERRSVWMRLVAWTLLGPMLLASSGCAAILHGTEQKVTVKTDPAGGSVTYLGQRVEHGESITIRKEPEAPFVMADGSRKVLLHHKTDSLVVVDALLLLAFIVPGVVALGVDFGTGAWRKFSDPQVVKVSEGGRRKGSSAAKEKVDPDAMPEPEPAAKPKPKPKPKAKTEKPAEPKTEIVPFQP